MTVDRVMRPAGPEESKDKEVPNMNNQMASPSVTSDPAGRTARVMGVDLDTIRGDHLSEQKYGGEVCTTDGQPLPCDAVTLLDLVELLQVEINHLKDTRARLSATNLDYHGQIYGELRPERDALVSQVARLKEALRDVIFDLHNCEYGGDLPRCEHITDALRIARATKPYESASVS